MKKSTLMFAALFVAALALDFHVNECAWIWNCESLLVRFITAPLIGIGGWGMILTHFDR